MPVNFRRLLDFLWALADYAFKLFASAVLIATLVALMEPARPSGYMIMLLVLMAVFILGFLAKPAIWITRLQDDLADDLSSIDNNRYRYAKMAAITAISIVLITLAGFVVSFTYKAVLMAKYQVQQNCVYCTKQENK